MLLLLLLLTQGIAYRFDYYSYVIPHPDKVQKGGEDAFYADETLLAVADGVGGWNAQGVDPSLYSKTLCDNVKNYRHLENPKHIIQQAANYTNHILGSSTLLIVKLINETLNVANIGDCQYTIIRNNQVLHQSQEQQHSFNFPFQLGPQGDDAEFAQEFKHQIQINDIIILGSDGLYDNLDQHQILRLVNKQGFNSSLPKTLADTAFKWSLNNTYNSPFAKKAKRSAIKFIGGKSDDITVIVAKIINSNDEL